jgi:hypothetical protein
MPWMRNKRYLIEQIGVSGQQYGFMVHAMRYGEHAFFDFSTRRFVQDQPVQLFESIPEMTIPAIPGAAQRFVYILDTHDFPDGNFVIIYTNENGEIRQECYLEFFDILEGSPDPGAIFFGGK